MCIDLENPEELSFELPMRFRDPEIALGTWNAATDRMR